MYRTESHLLTQEDVYSKQQVYGNGGKVKTPLPAGEFETIRMDRCIRPVHFSMRPVRTLRKKLQRWEQKEQAADEKVPSCIVDPDGNVVAMAPLNDDYPLTAEIEIAGPGFGCQGRSECSRSITAGIQHAPTRMFVLHLAGVFESYIPRILRSLSSFGKITRFFFFE